MLKCSLYVHVSLLHLLVRIFIKMLSHLANSKSVLLKTVMYCTYQTDLFVIYSQKKKSKNKKKKLPSSGDHLHTNKSLVFSFFCLFFQNVSFLIWPISVQYFFCFVLWYLKKNNNKLKILLVNKRKWWNSFSKNWENKKDQEKKKQTQKQLIPPRQKND